jgi:ribosomal protein S10
MKENRYKKIDQNRQIKDCLIKQKDVKYNGLEIVQKNSYKVTVMGLNRDEVREGVEKIKRVISSQGENVKMGDGGIKIKIWRETVNKSPFKYGKMKEQYEMKMWREVIKIEGIGGIETIMWPKLYNVGYKIESISVGLCKIY